jgi:hypothetical protein
MARLWRLRAGFSRIFHGVEKSFPWRGKFGGKL